MTTQVNTKANFLKAVALIEKKEGVNELVHWLDTETDFFIAPASTNFHGNYEGGLAEHSLNVARFALHNFNIILQAKPDLEYLRDSVIFCGLFHDVCKVNFYNKQEKWTKDANNKWVSYRGYAVKDTFPFGHGEKSVYLILKLMKLTDAEALAIRWHMGHTEMSVNFANSSQNYAFSEAMNHPLVRLIHGADMLSMTIEDHIDHKNN